MIPRFCFSEIFTRHKISQNHSFYFFFKTKTKGKKMSLVVTYQQVVDWIHGKEKSKNYFYHHNTRFTSYIHVIGLVEKYGFSLNGRDPNLADKIIVEDYSIFKACIAQFENPYFWREALMLPSNSATHQLLLCTLLKQTNAKYIKGIFIYFFEQCENIINGRKQSILKSLLSIQESFLAKWYKIVIKTLNPYLISDLIPQILKFAHPFQLGELLEVCSNHVNLIKSDHLIIDEKQEKFLDLRGSSFETTHLPRQQQFLITENFSPQSSNGEFKSNLTQIPFDLPPPLQIDWTGILSDPTSFPKILSFADVVHHKDWLIKSFLFIHSVPFKHFPENEMLISYNNIVVFSKPLVFIQKEKNDNHTSVVIDDKLEFDSFEKFIFYCYLIHSSSANSQLQVVQKFQDWKAQVLKRQVENLGFVTEL
jgi:hypothetical protein